MRQRFTRRNGIVGLIGIRTGSSTGWRGGVPEPPVIGKYSKFIRPNPWLLVIIGDAPPWWLRYDTLVGLLNVPEFREKLI